MTDILKNSISKDDYEIIKELGRGSYSAVYKLRLKQTTNLITKEFALKVLKVTNGFPNPIELHIMSTLRHPNLMHSDTLITRSGKKMGILMDLAKYTLSSILDDLSSTAKRKIINDVTNGLHFLHLNNIIHLDIKCDNVLVSGSLDNPIAQLNDFGLSLFCPYDVPVKSSQLRITYPYRPPEIKDENNIHCYQKANDIWSLGMLYMTILNGKYPFKYYVPVKYGNTNSRLVPENEFMRILYEQLSCSKKLQIIKRFSNSFYCNIIEKMLDIDIDKRLTIDETLNLITTSTTPTGGSLIPITFKDIIIKPYHKIHINIVESILVNMDVDISILFLFYDLCYRSIPCITLKHIPKSITKTLKTFFVAIAWIAIKFYKNKSISAHKIASKFDVSTTKLITDELNILKYLKGVIHRSYLYEMCTCFDDYVICYDLCKNYNYMNIDIAKTKKTLSKEQQQRKPIGLIDFFDIYKL